MGIVLSSLGKPFGMLGNIANSTFRFVIDTDSRKSIISALCMASARGMPSAVCVKPAPQLLPRAQNFWQAV
jgi:hypothetical protein